MTWDIATARVKAGLAPTDATKDAELQVAMDAALRLAEQYCDRFFARKRETVTFHHVHSNTLSLKRYPLETIHSMNPSPQHQVHKTGGWIEFHHIAIKEKITIDYTGGYVAFPLDLEMALWGIFGNAYTNLSSTGGGGLSGGIKKLAITGIGSVDYDTSGGASTDNSSAFGGLMPAMAKAILDLYRRETC